MRKDVRMGFAVGGVLLAVLVVAILVFHRSKNTDRTVVFDTGGKPAVSSAADAATGDTSPLPDSASPAVGSSVQSPAPAPAPAAGNPATEHKPTTDAPVDKGGAKWDELFASTAADPIKAQLTSDTNKPKNKSKRHKPDMAAADLNDRHDAATPVANAPIYTGSTPTADASPARPVTTERLASPARKDSGRTHTVATGETFVSIARAVYGDGRYYQALVDANPSIDPDKLRPGMTIQVPPDSQVKQSSGKSSKSAPSSSKSSDGKTYTVQSGDSLYKISKKLYGTGEKSDALYEANKQTIGPDSTRLKIGMVLALPEAPAVR